MKKKLVIVESPSKAKVIGRYLGGDYQVVSSLGHIRDLPGGGKPKEKVRTVLRLDQYDWPEPKLARKVAQMGVDPYHGWNAYYEVPKGKLSLVEELKRLAKQAEAIYLATDLDREGEAIAWHLKEILGGAEARYHRVKFNAITKREILAAFEKPFSVNMDGVDAQQTRRFLDRVVGFMLSPLLWEKIARGLSAGRVQSPAVRLVIEREKEIKNFLPEKSWELWGKLKAQGKILDYKVTQKDGKPFKPQEASLDEAEKLLKSFPAVVKKVETVCKKVPPQPPFITSTLQQAASTRLKFGVKRTMNLAQRLYEHGFITYMRTDSKEISEEALQSIRQVILEQYGEPALPEKPRKFTKAARSQEAHEAIRPTWPLRSDQEVEDSLGRSERRLYRMIVEQTIASQMVEAEVETTKLLVSAGPYLLSFSGRRLMREGWMVASPSNPIKGLSIFPKMKEGDPLEWVEVLRKLCVTAPPRRYSEAGLVRELERRGIGRPSTYASIIDTIQQRGYVRYEKGKFFAAKLGDSVTKALCSSFPSLMSYDFTAGMEDKLDAIAQGERVWKEVLDEFFSDFELRLKQASKAESHGGMKSPKQLILESYPCPKCRRPLVLRLGPFGLFLGCSGYSEEENNCKYSSELEATYEPCSFEKDSEESEEGTLESGSASGGAKEEASSVDCPRCPKCGSALEPFRWVSEGRQISLCSEAPEQCDYLACSSEEVPVAEVPPTPPCENCGVSFLLKNGRFGPYLLCESCGEKRKFERVEGGGFRLKAKPIYLPDLFSSKHPGVRLVLREGKGGLFLAAENYPKVRECRSPSIEELKRFQSYLPEAWKAYADAPEVDPEGNKTFLRFDKKRGEHYVGSQKEGKWTKYLYRWTEDE